MYNSLQNSKIQTNIRTVKPSQIWITMHPTENYKRTKITSKFTTLNIGPANASKYPDNQSRVSAHKRK